jgi:hypothetical protein
VVGVWRKRERRSNGCVGVFVWVCGYVRRAQERIFFFKEWRLYIFRYICTLLQFDEGSFDGLVAWPLKPLILLASP